MASPTVEFKLTRRDPLEIYGPGAVVMCDICAKVLDKAYPLWGVHLQAALVLHSAHRVTDALAEVPALEDIDRALGRHLAIVDGERHG
jgi:hypothetical protein